MDDTPILPDSGNTAASYRQAMSWTITKEDWRKEGRGGVYLELKSAIPGTHKLLLPDGWQEPYAGGRVHFHKYGIQFETEWPVDVDLDLIHVNSEFKVKTSDGKCAVDIKGQTRRDVDECGEINILVTLTLVSINTDLLFDDDGSFILEAELLVEMKLKKAMNCSSKNSSTFLEEIKSFFDDKNSDIVVTAGDQEFKCHKAILSARSEVFKNTLAHNTVESNTNTIVIRDTPAQAVDDMLKYIYTGDVPEGPKTLTTDLLHIASMHQLHPLVEACLKNLIECLGVSSCISTFMLVDRYLPQDQSMREIIIMFMQCKAIEVVEDDDWLKLMDSNTNLAQELVRAIARATKERHKCQFCIVSYN